MRWKHCSFTVLVLFGLLLGKVLAEGRVRASVALQPMNVCELIGKHLPPPDRGHDPRRPSTPINRLITQIDQSIGEFWLANTNPERVWNFCDGPFGIVSEIRQIEHGRWEWIARSRFQRCSPK